MENMNVAIQNTLATNNERYDYGIGSNLMSWAYPVMLDSERV